MKHERIVLGGLFLLWSMAALFQALWPDARWLLAGAILVTAVVALFGLALFALHRLRGYWIEYVSPGVLGEGDGGFALIYHEGRKQLTLLGLQRPRPEADVLFVPREDSWTARVEPWAQSRRAQILDRLQRNPIARHCEIRSSSLL